MLRACPFPLAVCSFVAAGGESCKQRSPGDGGRIGSPVEQLLHEQLPVLKRAGPPARFGQTAGMGGLAGGLRWLALAEGRPSAALGLAAVCAA